MARIRRIIPFSFWPRNWGATGKTREIEEAHYYWDGQDLDLKLLEINYDDKESPEYKTAFLKYQKKYNLIGEFEYGLGIIENDVRLDPQTRAREIAKYRHKFGKISAEDLEYELLDINYPSKIDPEYKRARLQLDLHFRKIGAEEMEYELHTINFPDPDIEEARKNKLKLDLKFGKITEEEYDHALLDMKYDDHEGVEYKIAQLDLEKKHGNITHKEWEKATATLLGEPWFDIMGAEHRNTGDVTQMAIELDWNEHFVKFLESKGWTGITDDEIVDKWFEEAMRQMLDLELPDREEEISEPLPSPLARTQRTRKDNGRSEYS